MGQVKDLRYRSATLQRRKSQMQQCRLCAVILNRSSTLQRCKSQMQQCRLCAVSVLQRLFVKSGVIGEVAWLEKWHSWRSGMVGEVACPTSDSLLQVDAGRQHHPSISEEVRLLRGSIPCLVLLAPEASDGCRLLRRPLEFQFFLIGLAGLFLWSAGASPWQFAHHAACYRAPGVVCLR